MSSGNTNRRKMVGLLAFIALCGFATLIMAGDAGLIPGIALLVGGLAGAVGLVVRKPR